MGRERKDDNGQTGQDDGPEPDEGAHPAGTEGPEAEAPRESQGSETSKQLAERLLRLQADLENYKKRAEKDRAEFARYANQRLMADLLPVLDTMLAAAKSSPDRDGARMVLAMTMDVLCGHGLRAIEAEGQRFDPYRHEAVVVVESHEHDDEQIVEELQKGFMLNERVLRHSKVKVARKPAPEARQCGSSQAGGEEGPGDDDGPAVDNEVQDNDILKEE